jgi:hypothetical protein
MPHASIKLMRRHCTPPLSKLIKRKRRKRTKRPAERRSPRPRPKPLASNNATRPNGAVLHRTAPFSSHFLTSENPWHQEALGCEQMPRSDAPGCSRESREQPVPMRCPAYRAKSIRLLHAGQAPAGSLDNGCGRCLGNPSSSYRGILPSFVVRSTSPL